MVAERSNVANLTSATTEACLREGGFCVIKSQCPKDKLSSTKGLCGKSDKECCHSRNNNKSASQFHSFETWTIILSYLCSLFYFGFRCCALQFQIASSIARNAAECAGGKMSECFFLSPDSYQRRIRWWIDDKMMMDRRNFASNKKPEFKYIFWLLFLMLKAVVRMQRSSSWSARSLWRWSRLLHPH